MADLFEQHIGKGYAGGAAVSSGRFGRALLAGGGVQQLMDGFYDIRAHGSGRHDAVGCVQDEGFAGPGVHMIAGGQATLVGDLRKVGAEHRRALRSMWLGIGVHADSHRRQAAFVELVVEGRQTAIRRTLISTCSWGTKRLLR